MSGKFSKDAVERRAQQVGVEPGPHGPVSEQFMRHYYGAARGKELARPHAQLADRLRRIASGEWELKGDEAYLVRAAEILDSITELKL